MKKKMKRKERLILNAPQEISENVVKEDMTQQVSESTITPPKVQQVDRLLGG